jgi:hypothetical protein
MKKTYHLIRVAKRLENKYASQSLQEILENAAGSGERSVNGIMNFPAQAAIDKVNLTFDVNVKSTFFGGYDIDVSPPTVDPPEKAVNYARLPTQIKAYLDKHASSFQLYPGTTKLEYSKKPAENTVAQN